MQIKIVVVVVLIFKLLSVDKIIMASQSNKKKEKLKI